MVKIEVANEDGNQRSAANVRELVTSTVLNVIAMKYYPTKIGTELTEAEARAGLEQIGRLDQVELDEVTFEREVKRITRMDGSKVVTDRILAIEMNLIKFAKDRRLEGVAVIGEMGKKLRSGGGKGSDRWSCSHGISRTVIRKRPPNSMT